MDLTSKQTIQLLLKNRGLEPQKRFGQNFLINERVPEELVTVAEINKQDTVLEIGPGIGAITQALAQKAKRVIAVEKDRNMVEILKETLRDIKNVEIINDDILKISNSKFLISNYKVVGNLPFYLTAPLIRMFLELIEVRPQSLTLVMQKEVAQRICAKPPRPNGARLAPQYGAAKMSILANSVQFYADPKLISIISKNSFWPQPDVDAAIIKICPYGTSPAGRQIQNIDKDLFFKIMKAGFSHPRKQLLNNLAHGLKMERGEVEAWLQKNNISPQQRAETLSVEDWINLTRKFFCGVL